MFDAILFFVFGSLAAGSLLLALLFGLWPVLYITVLSGLVCLFLYAFKEEI